MFWYWYRAPAQSAPALTPPFLATLGGLGAGAALTGTAASATLTNTGANAQ